MLNKRVTFASAIGLAVLALFMLNGAEAASLANYEIFDDGNTRVDADFETNFMVDFTAESGESLTSISVYFEGTEDTHDLTCSDCVGLNPDGAYTIIGVIPQASSLVSNPLSGNDKISWGIFADVEGGDDVYWPAQDAYCQPGIDFDCGDVRVNTLPALTDDAAVAGDDMPESTRTLTITYTDVDGHAGTVSAVVCDASDVCENSFSLDKQSGDETSGAVYGADFVTGLGGALTATITASDGNDPADDDRTASFTVDTETPWLKTPSSSLTSAGESESILFSVIYCVFDTAGTGTPTVSVDVGGDGGTSMDVGDANTACKNGVDYSIDQTVAWASGAQVVTFSASNDLQSADSVTGTSVTINDAPTLVTGTAERHFNGNDFVFNVTVSDVNSDDGDTLTVYYSIDDVESAYGGGDCAADSCTVTISEASILDQGGERSITFRVEDVQSAESDEDAFGQTIDVTKTSSFVWTAPADGLFQPGSDSYSFDITNNGNYEDTFTVTATSDNGWVDSGSSSQMVTVGKGATETFTITMDIAHVAAGLVDHWSASAIAENDDTQTASHNGQTTVDSISDVSVTIGTDTGSALPNGQVSYFFVITNTGNDDEAFDYATTSQNTWGLAGGSGTTDSLSMGSSQTITVIHTVGENADSGDTDTITFNAAGGFPDGASRTATTSAEQNYGVSIVLSDSSDNGLVPGDAFTVTYAVTNNGNGADSFTVFFDSSWLSSSSSTSLNLGGGSSGSATATFTVPSDAASGSSSSISAYVTGGGSSSDDSGSVTKTVSADTRSATVDTDSDSYSHNEGASTSGIVTITNTGVTSGFAIVTMDDALSFDTSVILLSAGQSGTLSFTVHAAATGDVSFSVSDAVDGIGISHTFGVTVNTFDSALLTDNTSDCGESNIACTPDTAGGWNDASNTYTNAGTFFTTMTVTDSNGMQGTHTFSTTIVNSAPAKSTAMDVGDATAGSEQTFMFSVPTDSDGTITHMVVDFGDGNSITLDASKLTGSTVSVTHTYELTGAKTVTATAYDNSGSNSVQSTNIEVGDRTVEMGDNSYLYNLIFLIGLFLLGAVLAGTSFKMQQGEIAGDEEMNERDRQRLESVERRMESLSEREELLEVSAYDASRAATKLEEHISAFNEILVKAQEIAATEKLKELEAAEEATKEEEEQMQLDLEDPDIEMVAERFHNSLAKLVNARSELSKIEEQLAHILKMERDEQLEKLTEMTESYETTKRKIDALQSSAEARDAAAVENNIMNLLSAAASGGSVGGADFGDFGDIGDDEEYEVEIYEDEDGSFYYIDPDTGEEVPCDEDGNAL
ncbi:MAG: PKD domain-containing protein [Candidatus Poseidoniales archaeon]